MNVRYTYDWQYLTFIQFIINFCLKLNWKLASFNFPFIFQFSIFNFQLILLKLFGSIFGKQKLKNKIEKWKVKVEN